MGSNGIADALDPRLVLGRLELGALELRDRVLDRFLALGRVEPLARGRGEDEIQHAALLGRELRLDQVGRLLCIRARNVELVLQAATDRGDEGDQDDEDAEPTQEDSPRMRRAGSVPARKRSGGEAFVGRQPVRGVAPIPIAAGS